MMRAARFEVAFDLLREVLHMPEGSALIRADATIDGNLVLVVTHPDLPDADDPHDVTPTVTRHDAVTEWDWGLPR